MHRLDHHVQTCSVPFFSCNLASFLPSSGLKTWTILAKDQDLKQSRDLILHREDSRPSHDASWLRYPWYVPAASAGLGQRSAPGLAGPAPSASPDSERSAPAAAARTPSVVAARHGAPISRIACKITDPRPGTGCGHEALRNCKNCASQHGGITSDRPAAMSWSVFQVICFCRCCSYSVSCGCRGRSMHQDVAYSQQPVGSCTNGIAQHEGIMFGRPSAQRGGPASISKRSASRLLLIILCQLWLYSTEHQQVPCGHRVVGWCHPCRANHEGIISDRPGSSACFSLQVVCCCCCFVLALAA